MTKSSVLFAVLFQTFALQAMPDDWVKEKWMYPDYSHFGTQKYSDVLGTEDAECKVTPSSMKYTCPTTTGWTSHVDDQGIVCIWVSSIQQTYESAKSTCQAIGGDLVSILSASRQETIQGLLKGSSFTGGFWIGLRGYVHTRKFSWPNSSNIQYNNWYNTGGFYNLGDYFNYYYTSTDVCFNMDMNLNGKWIATTSCSSALRFLCEQPPVCAAGLFGEHCDRQCHCHGESCSRDTNVCQYGCHPGWMGKMCCNRKDKSDFVYYCVNSKTEGRYLLMKFDPKGVTYDIFRLVDTEGLPISCLGMDLTRYDKSGVVTITIDQDFELNLNRSCGGHQTGENEFTWYMVIREKFGVVLPLDRNLEIHCDFSKADNFERQAQQPLEKEVTKTIDYHTPPKETPTSKLEIVILEFIDPANKSTLHQASLGSNVELRMRLNISGSISAQGVSPYNCNASSVDGTNSVQLTNLNGCPMSLSPMSAMTGSDGTVTSQPFELFTFEGHDQVRVTCSFALCFSSALSRCNDRCKDSSNRKRRSAVDRNLVSSAYIRVLPVKDEDFTQFKDNTASILLHPLPMSLLVALLVVVSGGLAFIFIRFCRHRAHHQWISVPT